MTENDELDATLRDWAVQARTAAEQPFTDLRGRSRGVRHRSRVLLAGAVAVIGVGALAIALTMLAPTGANHTPVSKGSGTPTASTTSGTGGPCQRNFAVRSATLTEAEQHLSVSLVYRGDQPCSVRQSRPGVRLIPLGPGGVPMTPNPPRGRTSNPPPPSSTAGPMVTIKHGQTVTFSITGFHQCLATPPGDYLVVVDLDSATPPASPGSGVSVPIGHLDPSPLLCLTNGIGGISSLSVSP